MMQQYTTHSCAKENQASRDTSFVIAILQAAQTPSSQNGQWTAWSPLERIRGNQCMYMRLKRASPQVVSCMPCCAWVGFGDDEGSCLLF